MRLTEASRKLLGVYGRRSDRMRSSSFRRRKHSVERAVHLQRAQRPGAMAQEVLFLGRQFRQPATVRQLEDRVEAKAVGAARRGGDRAGEDPFAGKDPPVGEGEEGGAG